MKLLLITILGFASWYGPGFVGKTTASGTIFTGKELTAAHKTLPFGTCVEVVNLSNDKSVVVTIDDRGPFIKNRIIDLSHAAACEIDLDKSGVAKVSIKTVECEG
jgi:rare lipoprotein A